mgnify:CR=1 FL=1
MSDEQSDEQSDEKRPLSLFEGFGIELEYMIVDAATLDASTGGWLCVPALRVSFSDKLACLNDQTNRGCAPSEITDGTPCDPVGRTATSCTTCIRLGTGEYAYNPSSCQCTKP